MFGTMLIKHLTFISTKLKSVLLWLSTLQDSTLLLLFKTKFKWWMFLVMTLFRLNQLESRAVLKFSFLMEAIFLLLLKGNRFSFTTFGQEKAQEVSFLKVIMVELSLYFGMTMTQDFIVLQMMETCICGIFRTILQELTSMWITRNQCFRELQKLMKWIPVI